jgi:hypothetical protein
MSDLPKLERAMLSLLWPDRAKECFLKLQTSHKEGETSALELKRSPTLKWSEWRIHIDFSLSSEVHVLSGNDWLKVHHSNLIGLQRIPCSFILVGGTKSFALDGPIRRFVLDPGEPEFVFVYISRPSGRIGALKSSGY